MGLFWDRPPKVEKLRRQGQVEDLVRALEYEDPITDRDGRFVDLGAGVRESAARALAETDDPLAREALIRALGDPDEAVRQAASSGLRGQGDPAAVDALVEAVTGWLDSRYETARSEALDVLAELGDPRAPRRVAAILLTREEAVTDFDERALRRLADAAGGDTHDVVISGLVAALEDRSVAVRARAMLAWFAPATVEPLLEALSNPARRREAAIAVGSTRDARAVEPLSALLLSDAPPHTRAAAAWGLGEIRHPAAAGPLLHASADSDYLVRDTALAAFDRLGRVAIAVATNILASSPDNGIGTLPAAPNGRDLPAAAAELPIEARGGPALRRLLGRPGS